MSHTLSISHSLLRSIRVTSLKPSLTFPMIYIAVPALGVAYGFSTLDHRTLGIVTQLDTAHARPSQWLLSCGTQVTP